MTRASKSLKNLHFNGLLLTKVYNAWAKKVQRSYIWWHSRLIQNLKESWLVLPKINWGIWQSFTRALESLNIGTFMASFYRNLKMYELKIYRGIMCHDIEEWYKNWRGIGLSFQSWHKEFGKFWLDHWKVSKMYTLMGCFWPTYIIFELRKYRWVCLMALKKLMQSLKGNWLMLPKMNWGIWQVFIRGRSKV